MLIHLHPRFMSQSVQLLEDGNYSNNKRVCTCICRILGASIDF